MSFEWVNFGNRFTQNLMKMLSEIDQKNPIVRHSFEFAVMVEAFCADLRAQQKFDLARQLFRAGTSIGANIWEAQEAESKAILIQVIQSHPQKLIHHPPGA